MKAYKRSYKYTCEKCGKFSRIRRDYCEICGAQALRKATKDDYKKVAERVMIEQKEVIQVRAKMKGIIDKQLRILQALVKNEAEYKKLLERKKSGESVEDLITKNRDSHEKLKKEDKEKSEIAIKWGRSEEGRKMFAKLDMWVRMNPKLQTRSELGLRMTTLNEKIRKNEEEYEKLLERKNKGEYVDDLIKQNRYTAERLKKSLSYQLTIREKIFHYLKKRSGKAFTAQALYNRIEEIDLDEEAKAALDMDALEEILTDLSETGKITHQDKEGKIFYSF